MTERLGVRGVLRAFRAVRRERRMWFSRRGVVLGGTAVALLLAACLALGPVVRARIDKIAAQRGMVVEAGHVWPRLSGARLADVRFRTTDSAWLSGEIAAVDVRVGLGLGVRGLRVRDGRISLSGSIDEVTTHLRELTKGQKSTPSAQP